MQDLTPSSTVEANQDTEFLKITMGVNGGTDAADLRWENYKKNVVALLKGGNPYENMRAALARVGITTNGGKDYRQQFGVTLTLRKPVEIEGGHSTQLLAAMGEALVETPDGPDLTAAQQDQLWAQAEPLLEQLKQSPKEKSAMWISDFRPDAGLLVSAALAVATASPALAANRYALGRCLVAAPGSGAEISPIYAADSYLVNYHGNDPRYKEKLAGSGVFPGAKITLLKKPAHGSVSLGESELAVENGWYHYLPNEGYVGQDRFAMQVEKDGVKVRIEYLIEAVAEDEHTTYIGEDGERHGLFCKPEHWKISQSDFNSGTQDYAAWLRSSELSTLLANASQSLTGFQDLTGSAVGTTTGEGANASITLDPTAAGHGWYVDATPLDNTDDYLPTSNPNIWQAKAGSDAAGKMDMLSVLLHEYGHALGLEHSADSRDFMAETLQAGQRKLPTADELQLMANLVAQLKGDTPTDPATPDSPSAPGLPTSLALAGLLAARRKDTSSALLSQKLVSVNPTLQNTQFAQGSTQGWSVDGVVSADGANNTITLSETSTSQTSLMQAFTLGSEDRFLSFTVDHLNLGSSGHAAPADAFEVALLDATTYAPLLGNLGLTHSDAALNLQHDTTGAMQAREAAAVHSVSNPDGSTTYTLDLRALSADPQAPRNVLLSFDLLGFGAADSSVTLRNIHMSSAVNQAPVVQDITAQLAEDMRSGTEARRHAAPGTAGQRARLPVCDDTGAHDRVKALH